MPSFRIWEVGEYVSRILEARSMFDAVTIFAREPVVYCHGGSIGSGPGVYVAASGNARVFHASRE